MLSARLVKIIEEQADAMTRSLLKHFFTDIRIVAMRRLSEEDMYGRVYDVYHNLERWLGDKNEEAIAQRYAELGRKRFREGIPLSEVILGQILIKDHLRDFIRTRALVDSAVQLYQEEELHLLVSHFFDRAIYHTVHGYEQAAQLPRPAAAAS